MHLRLLLWPILWWGFSSAMYCAEEPPLESAVQLAPPAPLKLDLSRVSEAAIERTVEHLQQLVHEAESRAITLDANLSIVAASLTTARAETATVQAELTTSQTQLAKAQQREVAWRRRARELMFAVAAFGGAASLRFLALVPPPWRYLAALAIASALYAALYFVL